ncbi:hypothetical protein NONO_c18430 [Nocardia nova SH22a]|uniref:Uncharacterized protein n=1 Tax=Nocardia nova SH22a TaxID=1415166 RepID=W5TCD0_9NOCA|nr:hypothetical protein NONO_c18430 [Nocardia nova SH22a]
MSLYKRRSPSLNAPMSRTTTSARFQHCCGQGWHDLVTTLPETLFHYTTGAGLLGILELC